MDIIDINVMTIKPYLGLLLRLSGIGNLDDLDKFKRNKFWNDVHEESAKAINDLATGLASQIDISNSLRAQLAEAPPAPSKSVEENMKSTIYYVRYALKKALECNESNGYHSAFDIDLIVEAIDTAMKDGKAAGLQG